MSMATKSSNLTLSDPPFAVSLFSNPRWSWIWLIIRLYLGYTWLHAAIGKLSQPGWVKTGEILKSFWERAVAIPDVPAKPLIAFDWYRTFLQTLLDHGSYTWFAKLVVMGEFLIGIALILGLFTGMAAFFSGFMNWNFLMAGTVSTSPVMLPLAILLILAWKTAGWWGLDRWVLPALGTPWQPGSLFKK